MKTKIELVKVDPAEYGLQATEAATIEKAFLPMLEKMSELEEEFNDVMKMAASGIDKEAVKAAKDLRLKYVKTRTGTAEIHKTAKAYYLAGGRFVDGWKNAQLFASQGKEQELEKIEKHFEYIEAERIQKIKDQRYEQLHAVGYMDDLPGIELMDDSVFENFLKGAEQQIKLRQEAERQEAEARMKAEHEERIQNERKQILFKYGNLISPTFDFDVLKSISEDEFQEFVLELEVTKTRIEKEQKQREQEAERARLEAEQVAKNERKERERVAAELEAKNKAEREAALKRQEAERRALGLSEEEKFKILLSDLYSSALKHDGKFTTEKGKGLFSDVIKLITKIEKYVKEEIKK